MGAEIRRQLVVAFGALLAVAAIGAGGYHLLGGGRWSWGDCLYMTIITLSTVGFGEVLPDMSAVAFARAWTLALILFGSGTLLFFVSTLTAFIVEGDIQGVLRRRNMQKRIDKLQGHFIVVGVGATGIHVVGELLASKVPFVVIDQNRERLEAVAEQLGPDMLYVDGDATMDTVLEQAGIGRAKGLAATLREDKDNVFVSITARALNPSLRIVAKVTEDNAETKLRRAGADSTVSPSYIGGQRLASELVRPSVVQFLDRMRSQDLRVEEVPIPDGSPLIGSPLRNTTIRHQTNVLVLAVRQADGSYSYSPGPDFLLEKGQTLVVLCRSEDLDQLRAGIASGSIGRVMG
ncbi:MAG: potassium channel family protein [Polyangiales bacterium]